MVNHSMKNLSCVSITTDRSGISGRMFLMEESFVRKSNRQGVENQGQVVETRNSNSVRPSSHLSFVSPSLPR